jgi:hypothetical protein
MMGADAPIPSVTMMAAAPAGRSRGGFNDCFLGPIIALPCPVRGPEAGSPHMIGGLCNVY